MSDKSDSQRLEPRADALKNIQHIVVLMLENRSFDNLLGWLYAHDEPPDGQQYEGLTWNLWNPLNNIDSDGIPFKEIVPVEMNGQKKNLYYKLNLYYC